MSKGKEIELMYTGKEGHFNAIKICIPRKMRAEGLLDLIDADKLTEYDHSYKTDEDYGSSGNLKNGKTYAIQSRNIDRTIEALDEYLKHYKLFYNLTNF